jgi:uncharacterized protein (TIGR03083 family)
MDFDRYLDALQADAALLAKTARADLTLPVPSCPGWSVRDVVTHLATVYQHKIACMRLGREPESWPPTPPAGDPVDWLEASLAELVGELVDRGPAAPSYTWFEEDQTVGFWYRRMAQETAVHRVDVQLAFGPPTPVDADIAADGIDEVLNSFIAGDWSDLPLPGPTRVVAVRADDQVWSVTLHPESVVIGRTAPVDPDFSLTGSPNAVLLSLWHRVKDADGPTTAGDRAALDTLNERLRVVTGS